MHSGLSGYEARYGWTGTVGWALVGCAAFVAGAIVVAMPLALRIVIVACFGLGIANVLAGLVGRQVAFRIDQVGVTLGGNPLWYRSGVRTIPWADITGITTWERYLPLTIGRWTLFRFGPISYVGIRRQAGAPALSRDGAGRADRPAHLAPVPGIAAGAARSAGMWSVDRDRLAAAVATWAPQVVIEDLRE